MAGRNRNGDGTFYRRKNGRLEYRITYVDEYGDSKRKTFTGDTTAECLEQAKMFQEVLDLEKRGIDCSTTLTDILRKRFADDFADNYVTEAAYDRNLKNVMIIEKSKLGQKPIIYINERDLELFFRSITSYSNSTIDKIYYCVKSGFAIAIEEGIIGRNLMNARAFKRKVKSSKPNKKVRGFTRDEQDRFLKALEEHKVLPWRNNDYKNQMLIELYAGMRMGEINALKAEDVDFVNGVIHVRRTISKGLNDRSHVRESTKTVKGMRDVPINDLVRPVLEDAIRNAPYNRLGLIFYDAVNRKVITTSQVNNQFKRILVKAGIENRGQHALRHTFATRAIEAGVDPIVLRDWLGHTDIHITLDTYADVFTNMNRDAMQKFVDYNDKLKEKNGK